MGFIIFQALWIICFPFPVRAWHGHRDQEWENPVGLENIPYCWPCCERESCPKPPCLSISHQKLSWEGTQVLRNVKRHPGLPSHHTTPAFHAGLLPMELLWAPFIQTTNFYWCFPNALCGFVHHSQPDLAFTAWGKGHILSRVRGFGRSRELLSQ